MKCRTRRTGCRLRRGVLLLVIVAMLAMFGLVAVTFVVIAAQAMRAATAVQRIDEYLDDPRQDAHQAAMQVFRGTNNAQSVIGPHSLLEDLYGATTVAGVITAFDPLCGGEILEFQPAADEFLSEYGEQRVGCVLTFDVHANGMPGPATGLSTRIVAVRRPGDGTVRVQILTPPDLLPDGQTLGGGPITQILAGGPIRYLVNGAPFSGPGIGYNPQSGLLDLIDQETGQPLALLPNPATLAFRRWLLGPDEIPGTADDRDSLANEDYDAADYQNMLLAAQVPNAFVAGRTVQTIPSLHRPALVNYFLKNNPALANDPQFLRRIVLRPLTALHPRFDGSNPAFNPVTGPWDVDNDGDGVPDSVWVDLGMPVRAAPDGRLYKPLFAILCVDLDGRLNLNAHGNFAQTQQEYYLPPQTVQLPLPNAQRAGEFCYAFSGEGQLRQVQLPRGLGTGPAEINLQPLFQYPGTPGNYLLMLLGGNGSVLGRYGENPAAAALPGWTGIDDPLSRNLHYHLPDDYRNVSLAVQYKSPPDLKGLMSVGLGRHGNPLWTKVGGIWANAGVDDPYEIDLGPKAARGLAFGMPRDNPFSPAELERILRPFDRDVGGLPQRLAQLAPGLLPTRDANGQVIDPRRRLMVTTESWDLPCPSVALPPHLRQDLQQRAGRSVARHVSDLLVAKGVAREYWPALLPPELLAGLKMDINRPFGDGYDNTQSGYGRGVVDEPAKVFAQGSFQIDPNYPGEVTQDRMPQVDQQNQYIPDIPFDHVAGVDVNGDRQVNAADRAMVRQLYARYLYVLARLLMEEAYRRDFPNESQLEQNEAYRRELTIRRLAQWAVNVVDFRDADAVMTPFEYDTEPFTDANGDGNPWDVDGVVGAGSGDDGQPYRRLVWGCERPELVLTETLAFHDRRVVDSAWDSGPQKKRTDKNNEDPPAPGDETLDQARIPQGSAFFELYCPRNSADPTAPAELYGYDPQSGRWYLDLSRLAPPDPQGRQYPVWRLVISESRLKDEQNNVLARLNEYPESSLPEPEQYVAEPDLSGKFTMLHEPGEEQRRENVQIERIVWFSPMQPSPQHVDADRIYFRRLGAGGVYPGQYLVVGPRDVTVVGARKPAQPNTPVGTPAPQMIRLLLGQPPGMIVADVNGATNTYPSNIKPVAGMVVAGPPPAGWTQAAQTAPQGIGISISEPLFSDLDYYPEPTQDNAELAQVVGRQVRDAYGDLEEKDEAKGRFKDDPLDSRDGMPLAKDGILGTGTVLNYKTAFLQRLANPMQPWHPIENPYLTVDWLPIDLTVFNGEDTQPSEWPPQWAVDEGVDVGPWDPDDPTPGEPNPLRFGTRQRGIAGVNFNLWAQVSDSPEQTSSQGGAVGGQPPNFRHNLRHTIGYLNRWYWENPQQPSWYTDTIEHLGDPRYPFPWLPWNDRPFVSQLELLIVPASDPRRLLSEYMPAPAQPDPYTQSHEPFPHLLEFFLSGVSGAGNLRAGELHRLLEYLGVPSPFSCAHLQLNPQYSSDLGDLRHRFHPPFHRLSTYREPGRINLNTIYSPEVWQGLMNYFPDMNTDPGSPRYWQWDEFVRSRRGYDSASAGQILAFDDQYPTFFAKPFRSFAGADYAPLSQLRPTREVECTLLRSEAAAPGSTANDPLFAFDNRSAQGLVAPYNDPTRNPWFYFQGLQRLGNLVTTRSNVYAVWITVGYFEVEPNPFTNPPGGVDEAHLDGYALGQELGIDTGEVQRHRAFYIFDRSMPVGFVRGRDVNVEKAILLRRFVE